MLNFKNFLLDFANNLTKLNARGQDYTQQIARLRSLFLVKNQILNQLNQLQFKLNNPAREPLYSQNENKPHDSSQTEKINNIKKILHQTKQVVQILKKTVQLTDILFQFNLLQIPNLPSADLLLTTHQQDKIIFTSVHTQKKSSLSHWQIGQKLSWLEQNQAVKMSQSRFVIYRNGGARLLRALINLMLDQHHKNGYVEMTLPYLVKAEALLGTGQFPKLKDDTFALHNKNLFLIPTSEVSLVNFFAQTFLSKTQLPYKVCSYSPCFRQEAGAAGTSTTGLLRLHQFHKVELVKITDQDTSDQELDKMIVDAKNILELLELPYRLVKLSAVNLSFAASKTYDLEVWMPFQGKYVEIASLSNTTDFQSNYLQIKYRDHQEKKHFAHTLNGSGLAVDRLIACLLEHYYDVDKNTFCPPPSLQPYFQ